MTVTRAFLENLFSSFSLPLPDRFKTPEVPLLSTNYTLPSGVSEDEVAYIGAFVLCAGITISSADLSSADFTDSGRAHMFHEYALPISGSGNGWVWTDTVLVRLNNSYIPNAKFPVWSADPIEDASGFSSRIGYDAAVCVEMYEPWIVQTYNSSLGVPTTMTIVGKSDTTDFEADDGNKGPHLDSYTRALNSTGKFSAYYMGYAGGFHLNATESFSVVQQTPSGR